MIALDTNVLIYCCDRRDPRRQQIALDLVADTADGILPVPRPLTTEDHVDSSEDVLEHGSRRFPGTLW